MAAEVGPTPKSSPPSLFRVRVWHLVALVGFVALAIADIQDHRRFEPTLLALAGGGYVGFGLLAWLGWNYAGRFEKRLGRVGLIAAYLSVMGAVFLLAVVIYLTIEHAYLGGWR